MPVSRGTPSRRHRIIASAGMASRRRGSQRARRMDGKRIARRLGAAAWKQRRTKAPRRIDRRLEPSPWTTAVSEAAVARVHTHTRAHARAGKNRRPVHLLQRVMPRDIARLS